MKSFTCPLVLLVLLLASSTLPAQSNSLASPNGLLKLSFSVVQDGPQKGQLVYDLAYKGKLLLVHSSLAMDIQNQPQLGNNVRIVASSPSIQVDETYTIPAGKSNPVRNFYNQTTVALAEPGTFGRHFSIEARAYDDGVAFRYLLSDTDGSNSLYITSEQTAFQFSKDATTYPLILVNYRSSYEDSYHVLPVRSLHLDWLVGLPLLAEVPGVAWLAITEADIGNYAGMYLQRDEGEGSEWSLKTRLSPRLDLPGVAVVGPTPLRSPWRAIMVADNPGRLIESNMVINLNPPCAIADTSWIKPGKAAWDWWSGSYAEGVEKPGMNTATMKHYIDFASKSHFEYMMIDAFWAAHTDGPDASGADLTRTQPNIDMPEILEFAKSRNVRIWLWAHWADLDRQMDEAFPLFEKWGIAGVKIDQLNRDDQWMIDFYRRTAQKAAEHHLMLDFHGVFKPYGFQRTYPNVMTQEGVMGLEYNKWSERVTPDHNVMLAFTRMLAGPLDYTPGGFRNTRHEDFEARELRPEVLGTRAHQTALFVVFESPFEMVADYPEAYAGQKELAFISVVPTSWDETRVLNAKVGDYVTIARRRGSEWYIGSIAGWHGADLDIPLNVLGPGQYVADIYSDAPDAELNPTHTTLEVKAVSQSTILKAKLVSGGGQAIRIRPATAADVPAKKHS